MAGTGTKARVIGRLIALMLGLATPVRADDLPPPPIDARGAAIALLERDTGPFLVLIGGQSGDRAASPLVHWLDISLGRWQRLASLPGGGRRSPIVIGYRNRLHIIGGDRGKAGARRAVAETFRLDPAAGEYAARDPMPEPATDAAMVVGGARWAYFIGGMASGEARAVVQAYDLLTGQWVLATPLPELGRVGAAAGISEGRIVVTGGRTEKGAPATQSWYGEINPEDPRDIAWAPIEGPGPAVLGEGYRGLSPAGGEVSYFLPVDGEGAVFARDFRAAFWRPIKTINIGQPIEDGLVLNGAAYILAAQKIIALPLP